MCPHFKIIQSREEFCFYTVGVGKISPRLEGTKEGTEGGRVKPTREGESGESFRRHPVSGP